MTDSPANTEKITGLLVYIGGQHVGQIQDHT
jgi:hypothetical protein